MHTEAQLCIPLDKRKKKKTSQMDEKLSLEALWLQVSIISNMCVDMCLMSVSKRELVKEMSLFGRYSPSHKQLIVDNSSHSLSFGP